MLASVAFENFMALRRVDVPLEPLTVLVGPNASGKTSVLRGLHFIANARYSMSGIAADQAASPISELHSRGLTGPLHLRVSGAISSQLMALSIIAAGSEESLILTCAASLGGQEATWPANAEDDKRAALQTLPLLEKIATGIRSTAVLHLDAVAMAQPAYSDEAVPRVSADGRGLAAALAELAAAHPERMEALQEALRAVVPAVRQVRVPRSRITRTEWVEDRTQKGDGGTSLYRSVVRHYWGHEILFDTHGASGVPARLASEGTLLVLGLLAVLVGPDSPRLVLVDDVDRGLHPRAQGDLIHKLRALMEHEPELQIIATSHSPYLVEHLRPQEVRITVMEDGWARCGRLVDHPDYPRWKDQMTPGEFWSSVGEDWLKGTRESV